MSEFGHSSLHCGAAGIRHDILSLNRPTSGAKTSGEDGGYPEIVLVTTDFLFKRLQTGFPQKISRDVARRA
jgi:hypothetical protein